MCVELCARTVFANLRRATRNADELDNPAHQKGRERMSRYELIASQGLKAPLQKLAARTSSWREDDDLYAQRHGEARAVDGD